MGLQNWLSHKPSDMYLYMYKWQWTSLLAIQQIWHSYKAKATQYRPNSSRGPITLSNKATHGVYRMAKGIQAVI